jgi:hypothetical protein
MKTLIYQVYVGKRSKLYDHCVNSVAQYCKQHDIEHVVQKTPILKVRPDPFTTNRSKDAVERLGYLPIYEKENAFTYLKTRKQVAVVDSDIFIRPNAPNIFYELSEEYHFGGIVEREMPITAQYRSKIQNYSKMQYANIRNVDWKWNDSGAQFMNMGIMVMNQKLNDYFRGQTPIQFLSRPEFKPFIDGVGNWKWSTDQTLLNTWIRSEEKNGMKIKNLDWRFNTLYSAVRQDQIKKAFFVHFFLKDKLPMKGENVEELMRYV